MRSVLRLEAVLNIRDLGGIATSDGRRVAPGRLYRSASLHQMTDADRSSLEGLGIATIIDLRSNWERGRQAYSLEGARMVSAPLVTDERMASIVARFDGGTLTSEELEDWWTFTGVYQTPGEHLEAIRRVFDEFLGIPPGGAVLFHCRGGKDRTGVIAALLLEALGVPRPAMVRDFLLSNAAGDDVAATEDFARLAATLQRSGLSGRAIEAMTGVEEQWLHTLLDGISSRYGSVRSYLADTVGMGETGLRRLRETYLEPPGGDGHSQFEG